LSTAENDFLNAVKLRCFLGLVCVVKCVPDRYIISFVFDLILGAVKSSKNINNISERVKEGKSARQNFFHVRSEALF
jgi:hypothetical protein